MKVGELSRGEALERMRGAGLSWQVGPYAIRAFIPAADIADGFRFLYSDFPLLASHDIVDAELRVLSKRLAPWRFAIEVDGEVQYDWLPRRLVMPMAEWALNVCVFHRSHQYLMLHAAVVERAGRAAMFSGRAGSGKSTLCAALVNRGWRLLSDEVALIRPSDGRIVPAPRPVSLKERSIEVIRAWAPGAVLGPEYPRTSKGRVAHMLPPSDSVKRADEAAVPGLLVFPRFDADRRADLRRISKARAFLQAAGDSFNYSVLGRTGFETLAASIDRCACFELSYGDLAQAVERVDELASSDPRSLPA